MKQEAYSLNAAFAVRRPKPAQTKDCRRRRWHIRYITLKRSFHTDQGAVAPQFTHRTVDLSGSKE